MMDGDTKIKTFERDIWRLEISVASLRPDGTMCGAVNVFRAEVPMARLVSFRSYSTTDELIDVHEAKGLEWIAVWEASQHSGTTGFSELTDPGDGSSSLKGGDTPSGPVSA